MAPDLGDGWFVAEEFDDFVGVGAECDEGVAWGSVVVVFLVALEEVDDALVVGFAGELFD